MSRATEPGRQPRRRLPSLDIVRGGAMAGVILVNTAGGFPAVYEPLRHARNGFAVADLGFPLLVFIVGVTTHFSMAARRERGETGGALVRHALLRASALFALGLLATGFPDYDLATMPLLGVLQRIAMAYLCVALLELFTNARTEAVIAVVFLAGYWLLWMNLPTPVVGGPPRINDLVDLLAMFPFAATGLMGALAGRWLRMHGGQSRGIGNLAAAGMAAVVLGLAWGRWFPIGKYLWTSSYAVFTAGLAAIILAAITWVADRRGHVGWASPLIPMGRNPLVLFAGSTAVDELLGRYGSIGVAGQELPPRFAAHEALQRAGLSPAAAGLAYATLYLMIWLAIAAWLARRRIIIKV
ncbi:MAG TPA: heparan-alpha-glucosaminide N-acetyltransferase domain-containing protein [Gemmatimonadaceae bacterium]|nr:heparan-alpha-glucosaminide N-acetyltransferase domain-containing protein [Gemmatimonadaceae bacterium]